MSLPACEQRALNGMESTLKASEPRLEAKFAMFARLTVGEGPAGPERLPLRPPAWRRSTVLYMLFPVLAAIALIATLAIGLARTSLSACGTAASSPAPRPAAACGAHTLRPAAGTGSPEPGRR